MTTAEPSTPPRLTVRGLVTASMLAAGLLLLGAAPVQAGPIACGFGDNWGEGGEGCSFLSSEGGTQTTQYQWDDYFLELTLFNVGSTFNITITDAVMSNEEFQSRLSESLGGYTCIPLVDGSDGCRDFFFETEERVEEDLTRWTNYALTIDWLSWLGNPDTSPTRIRLLHNIGSIPGNGYDEDMCEQAENEVPNYIPCTASTDPFITSGDTDFQSFTPALAPVPEPATLLLLGMGAAGVVYRRLRA